MKTYTVAHKFIASLLLVNLLLPSCQGLHTPISLSKDKKAINQHKTAIKHLSDQELIAEKGHIVTFYDKEGVLQAEVAMHLPAGFSKTYQEVGVHIAEDVNVEELTKLPTAIQKRIVHFTAPIDKKPAKVCIYKAGLKGGMMPRSVLLEVKGEKGKRDNKKKGSLEKQSKKLQEQIEELERKQQEIEKLKKKKMIELKQVSKRIKQREEKRQRKKQKRKK